MLRLFNVDKRNTRLEIGNHQIWDVKSCESTKNDKFKKPFLNTNKKIRLSISNYLYTTIT